MSESTRAAVGSIARLDLTAPDANELRHFYSAVIVTDLEASLEQCRKRGGTVLLGPRDLGSYGRMGVIRDPAGASIALMQLPD